MKKKDIVKTILRDFYNTVLPVYVPRKITVPINSGKIVTLVGPRRSGKTYMLYQIVDSIIKQHIPRENIMYVNFEDERLELQKSDLDILLMAYRELYPEKNIAEVYFFFDEIQNIEGWEKFVRRIYDTITKNIFITGSNSKLLSEEIATSLRGRTLSYEILPLSFDEYLKFKKYNIVVPQDLFDSKIKAQLIHFFNEYMIWGSMPEIVLQTEDIKVKILQDYFDVMIYRDLIERYSIKDIFALKYFIKRVAESVSKPLSINKIYNELKSQGIKIGKNTMYDFFEYCENAFLIRKLGKSEKSIVKKELSEKKAYFIDNGLLQAIKIFERQDFGVLLENMIFRELYRKTKNICFFKESKECDFIVNNSIPIQVCFEWGDQKTAKREIEGLIQCLKKTGAKHGYIINFDDEEELDIDGYVCQIIPAYKWLLEQSLL